MLLNVSVLIFLATSVFGQENRPCSTIPNINCVRANFGLRTGATPVKENGLGENVYVDPEEVSLEDLTATLSYSGLYSGTIENFYDDGTNTYLNVVFDILPVYYEYTTTENIPGKGNNIFHDVNVTMKFIGKESFSLDDAEYTADIGTSEYDTAGLELNAATEEAARIARAYLYTQILTDKPPQAPSTVIVSTVRNRDCDTTDFSCIQSRIAELTGLKAITGETGNRYVTPELFITEFGSFNATEYAYVSYGNIGASEILDFYNDGQVTVLTVNFANVTGYRNFSDYLYTINNPPHIFQAVSLYYHVNLTITATFEGVDSISLDDVQAFAYGGGVIYESLDLADEVAAIDPILANAVAEIQKDPTYLYRETIYYNAVQLLRAYIYSKVASDDGVTKAIIE